MALEEAKPYPKTQALARANKRYRRKVASPKQWAAIRAEKLDEQPCRICNVSEPLEAHHLASRGAMLGDDVADNIVGVCQNCHARVTRREPSALADLAVRLTDAEYAFLKQTFGEGIMERLFGVGVMVADGTPPSSARLQDRAGGVSGGC